MPKFYISVILLINQSKKIGEKQFSIWGSIGGQNACGSLVPMCPLVHKISCIQSITPTRSAPKNNVPPSIQCGDITSTNNTHAPIILTGQCVILEYFQYSLHISHVILNWPRLLTRLLAIVSTFWSSSKFS